MFTFMACAGLTDREPDLFLAKTAATLQRFMPGLGGETCTRVRVLPEIAGGWAMVVPKRWSPRLSDYADDERAVLLFGTLTGVAPEAGAAYLAKLWREQGLEAVRGHAGLFAAVLVDRRHRQLYMVTDLLGRRPLSMVYDQGMLALTPHDLNLLASGLVLDTLDMITASGTVLYDWSPQGRSLLRGVRASNPNEILLWNPAGLKSLWQPMLDLSRRLPNEPQPIAEQCRRMEGRFLEVLRQECAGHSVVTMDLTGGFDSRTLLAGLLAIQGVKGLRATCAGSSASPDIQVARQIAQRLGVDFSPVAPVYPTLEQFQANGALIAYCFNGSGDGRITVWPPLVSDAGEPPHFAGASGELYRGKLYLHQVWQQSDPRVLANLGLEQAFALVERKLSRHAALRSLVPELAVAAQARFHESLEQCARMSPGGADLLDLFYCYEKTTRWSVIDAAMLWLEQRKVPFLDQELLRLGYALPAPIGYAGVQFMRNLVQRYSPEAMVIPGAIGSMDFLPFRPAVKVAAGRRWLEYARRLARRVVPPATPGFPQDPRGAFLVGPEVGEEVAALLLAEGSVAVTLFGRTGCERMVRATRLGLWNYQEVLGNCLVMERWRGLAHVARSLAAE